MPPDKERGGPRREAASNTLPPSKSDPRVPRGLPRRADCGHDQAPDCDEHGCPFCQDGREQIPWITPCSSCEQQRHASHRAFLALNPAVVCELEDCLHCAACDACSKTGQVCRNCEHCVACEEEAMLSPCELYRWDRVTRTQRAYFQHSLRDPITGRWGA